MIICGCSSGDHDMVIPYMSTLKWIHKLNISVDEEWRAWNVEGQVAGLVLSYNNQVILRKMINVNVTKEIEFTIICRYTEKYKNYLTFATVKARS